MTINLMETTTASAVDEDIALTVVPTTDVEVNYMALHRDTTELVLIEFSATINGVTTKFVYKETQATDIVLTDRFRVPGGATIRIASTGIGTANLTAVIVLDPRIPV